jgi:hypothetical protein
VAFSASAAFIEGRSKLRAEDIRPGIIAVVFVLLGKWVNVFIVVNLCKQLLPRETLPGLALIFVAD